MPQSNRQRGTSLVTVIIGVSVMLIVFGGFFMALNAYMGLAEYNARNMSALYVANEQIEKLRALPFDDVGTVGGLPSGTIPQLQSIVRDGRSYTVRTFIQYVDDPADGTGAGDTLAADYKKIKVEVSYAHRNTTKSVSLVSTMAPKSQESLIGAGILRINVLDAQNDPVPSATVHILNTTVATSVDITTTTNASGTVSFPGAWAGPGYGVTITKSGFSSAGTYTSTEAHNPSPSVLTVAENSTTEIDLKIDLLSAVTLYTREIPVFGSYNEPFDDALGLTTMTDTQILASDLTLSGAPGTYSPTGYAVSIPYSPALLGTWGLFHADHTTPPQTSVLYQFEYDAGSGVYVLIPEGDLPGNGAGFSETLIPLYSLDAGTYASLRVRATLTSTDSSVTPGISSWRVSYQESDVPRNGVGVQVRGNKTYGTDVSDAPVYRHNALHTTALDGHVTVPDLEFDEYTGTPSSVTVASMCPPSPAILDPDTTLTQTITLTAPSAHAYRLTVLSPLGNPVPFAEVRIDAGAGEDTQLSDACGVVYFPGLTPTTYSVTAHAEGYAVTTDTVAVSGMVEETITLSL